MDEAKSEGTKKKHRKSLGEVQLEKSFKIDPSEAPVKPIDTSEWPLLLKVR